MAHSYEEATRRRRQIDYSEVVLILRLRDHNSSLFMSIRARRKNICGRADGRFQQANDEEFTRKQRGVHADLYDSADEVSSCNDNVEIHCPYHGRSPRAPHHLEKWMSIAQWLAASSGWSRC